MCDPGWMLEHLRDDLAVQLAVYAGDPGYGQPAMIGGLDRPEIERLAELLDFPVDWGTGSGRRRQAAMLLNRYGQRAAIFILGQVRAFTQSAGKTLLVVVDFTARTDHFRGSVAPEVSVRRLAAHKADADVVVGERHPVDARVTQPGRQSIGRTRCPGTVRISDDLNPSAG